MARTVSVFLRAHVDPFIANMRRAGGAVGDLERRINTSTGRNRQALDRVGKGATIAAVGMVAGFGLAVKASMDFDKQMSAVKANAGATANELNAMRKAALEAGTSTAYSATQAAKAEEELAKAGVAAKDVIGGGLKGALDLAAAGQLEVGESAEIAATAMTQFGLSGKDVPHIADLLSAAANKAQGSVHDLGYAMKMGGLVANQFGLTVEDSVGTMAAFAAQGLIGSDAGTSFKTMLLHLASPTSKASNLMQELGINTYDAGGKFIGITGLANQLQTRLGGLSEAQRNQALATIFGSDAIRGANILYKQGSAGIQDWINKTNDSGNAARTAATKLDNLSGDLTKLKGALTTALIGAGDGAQGPLRSLAQNVTGVVNAFNSMPASAQSATIWVAGISGAAILGAKGLVFLTSTARDTRLAMEALGLTGARVGAGITAMRGALASAGSFLAGPWGVALVGAVGLVSLFAATKDRAAKATAEFTAAIKADSGAIGENTRAAVANKIEQEGLLSTARLAGVNLSQVTDAIIGNKGALEQVNGQLDAYETKLRAQIGTGGKSRDQVLAQIYQIEQLKKAIGGQNASLQASVASAKRVAEATSSSTGAKEKATVAAGIQAAAEDDLSKAMNDAATTADKLKEALDALSKGNMDADRAAIAQRKSVLDAAKASDHRRGLTDKEKSALLDLADANQKVLITQKANGATGAELSRTQSRLAAQFIKTAMAAGMGRAEATALAKRYAQLGPVTNQASNAMVGYINRVTAAATAQRAMDVRTGSATEAQRLYADRIRNNLPVLYALAGSNQAAKAQVDALARSSGVAAGRQVTTRAAFLKTAASMNIARGRALDLWTAFNKIKSKTVTLSVYAQGTWAQAGSGTQHAKELVHGYSGGAVPSLGPQSSRAHDSVPAMLRVDEHVWTPEEVDAVGGHASMYRIRRAALAGKLQGYAKGGAVSMAGSASSSQVSTTVLNPVVAGMAAMVAEFGNAVAAAWKKIAGSGGPVVAAARSQIGLPYSWGGGGSSGPSYGIGRGAGTYGFDCCLVPGTLVQTVDGPKKIVDIRPEDEVYTWDNGNLAINRVVARSEPRIQKTYRLSTHRRAVEASGNHPFLRMTRLSHGPGRRPVDWTPEWVHLDDLRPGDVVATLNQLPDDAEIPTDPWHADPDYLWLLGLAIADGSMSKQRRNRIHLCKFGQTREVAQERLDRLIGRRATEHPTHGMYLHDAGLAAALRRDGVDVPSSERRVPQFVWSLPHKLVGEFLDGYDSGDGHRSDRDGSPSITYGATSRELIDGVRNLHIVLGHNVTNVLEWKRSKPPVIRGKKVRNAKPMWRFTAYPESRRKSAFLLSHVRLGEIFPEGSRFQPEKILAIEETGRTEETYDIEVEGAHNFIADGIVVHNSGLTEYAWWQGRHKAIGGVTDSQWASSTPISGPRPGALAFPSGPGVHVMLGSNKPGYVIQAPHTGAFVEEVPRTSGNWRWPTGMATGGEVKLGEKVTSGRAGRDDVLLAKVLQIAGSGPRRGEQHDAQIARGGDMRLWAEPETGGEAYIPLAAGKRNRSKAILSSVARVFGMSVRGMADGGITGFADGGLPDVNLSDYMSKYTDMINPATKSDVTSAQKARRTQIDQLKNAEDALAKARKKHHKDWAQIRRDERRVAAERRDVAAATKTLADVEARYKKGSASPATQLGAALGLGIKNTGGFIKNLTALADRGFGTLAQQLLTMGGPEAEKIAADAVKFSSKKLTTLQGQVVTAQQQQATLTNLPNILAVRSAMKGGKGGTWIGLLNATGLDPATLATAVHLMAGDLGKTTSGKSLLADMKAHGYVAGGWIRGAPGVDRNLIGATAGEFMVRQRQASKYGPLIEAINSDRVGDALLRRYISGSQGRVRSGGGGDGSSAPVVNNTFHHQEMNPQQLSREVARETAWVLSA